MPIPLGDGRSPSDSVRKESVPRECALSPWRNDGVLRLSASCYEARRTPWVQKGTGARPMSGNPRLRAKVTSGLIAPYRRIFISEVRLSCSLVGVLPNPCWPKGTTSRDSALTWRRSLRKVGLRPMANQQVTILASLTERENDVASASFSCFPKAFLLIFRRMKQ